jgi:antiviral helicase SKI2
LYIRVDVGCRKADRHQADSTGLVDKKSGDVSTKTMNDLAIMHEELTSLPELPEVEWSRMRDLEFQEALRQRMSYLDRLSKLGCQLCENFEDHVSCIHLLSD